MRIPTVHLNGTSGLELFDQVVDAARGVENAIQKLEKTRPNARDYYVQGDKAWGKCMTEWQARIGKLLVVEKELGDIVKDITDQLKKQGVDPWAPR